MSRFYTIDAKGKMLGRVASEAAMILRGKNEPDFAPNKNPQNMLTIVNAKEIKVSGNKITQKVYKRYSGYPGGLREIKFGELLHKDPAYVLRKTIEGMLPRNRLEKQIIRNLTIYNDERAS